MKNTHSTTASTTDSPRYWLFKTEPDEYSIDDLAAENECDWEGIRNYQARNRLRDEVRVGDQVFIYHSSCAIPAIVGLATVVRAAFTDETQFDPHSPYYDAKSERDNPKWLAVSVRYCQHLSHPVTLAQVKTCGKFGSKEDPKHGTIELIARPRLSIQCVSTAHAETILALASRPSSQPSLQE